MIEQLHSLLQSSEVQGILIVSFIFFAGVLYIQILHDKYPESEVRVHFSIGGGKGKKKSRSKKGNHRSHGGSSRGSGSGRR